MADEMTKEEQAIEYIKGYRKLDEKLYNTAPKGTVSSIATKKCLEFWDMAIKALEQQPCEMTVEEYRQRMIQAFHNADTDELIAVCVLPTEKEFEHLEWLLKNHYKKAPCDDAISCKDVEECKELMTDINGDTVYVVRMSDIRQLPSVTQKLIECSECKDTVWVYKDADRKWNYCPNCGAKMQESEE